MISEVMKASPIGSFFRAGAFAAACALTACHTPHPNPSEFRCGFSDPETMANLGLCEIAAEYYVAHHEWPLSRAQMQSQLQVALKEMKEETTPEEARQASQFLDHFTVLEFHPKSGDLVMHFRAKAEQKTFKGTLRLKPGRTPEEILERSSG